ncbi:ABC transporter permease [Virgibacillus alimentarius]|uniref:Transport permease protein n=1 Tax=Virgibacillus alimentarius TaxID=698769 RepID=A0ABS4S7H5_9BACI|nr:MULTISPECIES: ABC transporter permease [Virgibacillus]MBP2257425.1 lipopolysaccharide transport system permease protein/teichoic acid transport system permease protein [Virgibacillus alimentarius]HLR67775.1 ABC transporter permease [Virgibacillus sp.]
MRKYLSEILKRKDLLIYLVKSGLKAENRNSYLGYFWWLLDPLLNVVVYYFLVGIVLGRGGEDFAVFLVIGLVPWRWINTTINTSAKSITKYSSIINQVNLPKSIFPLSFTFTQLFNFIFGLVVVGIFLIAFQVMPGWQIVYLPIIIVVQLLFLITVSLFLGYITVFVRDIDNVLTHTVRVFFYASPIIWEGGRLPDEYSWIVDINPIAIIINSYRDIIMYHQSPDFLGLSIIGIVSIVLGGYMLYHYSRNEHKIIKAL